MIGKGFTLEKVKPNRVRGHVQTIVGKSVMPIISTGHFIAELTLYQMLESGKDTSLHRPDDSGNV